MKLINPIIMSLSLALTSLAVAQEQKGPYKLAPEAPEASVASQAPKAPVAPASAGEPSNTKILSESYELTGGVIGFVENNLQLSQLCDERLTSQKHTQAFAKWFETQKTSFRAALEFKFNYEKTLSSLYGESIIETFQKRDRLTLKKVSNEIEEIASRNDKSFSGSCQNWYKSIEDKESFFHTKLSFGLTYFGDNQEKLAIMVSNPANW